jgi:FAD/FMN-containing dehydrogenase
MKDCKATALDGQEVYLKGPEIEALRGKLRGRLITAEDPDYDETRRVFNALIDRRPALIIQPGNSADVVRAVDLACEKGLLLTVRGGGHSVAGHAVADGAVMVDFSALKAMDVDPEARTVRAWPGLRLGEFDARTQDFGLATTLGTVSDTGISGLTLGGGIGWLMRKYGLACDNLLAAEVVTADGQVRRASETENPDLFWAIRGAGHNFGVVTELTYRLHPVGPMVFGGLILYPLSQARQVLRAYRDYAAGMPDEFNAFAACLTSPEGVPVVGIAVCHCGPVDEGRRLAEPLGRFMRPLMDMTGPMPYVQVQRMIDDAAPFGARHYWKSSVIGDLSDGAIDVLAELCGRFSSPRSIVLIQPLGGAVSRVGPEATAFAHRSGFLVSIIGMWLEGPADEHKSWVREVYRGLAPFSTGGAYVNDEADSGEGAARTAYGPNYERLARLKAKYDPDNLFRVNLNIRPWA